MRGLLFSQMDPPAELEGEFHDWYDTEHVPVRMRIPGFGAAVRYEADGPATRFLVCYFIDDLDVLDSDDYARVKREPGARTERMLAAVRGFTRYTCRLVDDTGPASPTGLTLVHALRVADAASADLEDRYLAELGAHGEPEWVRSRLYRPFGSHVGEPWTHLAIHDVATDGQATHDVDGSEPVTDRGSLPTWSGIDDEVWWRYRPFRRFGDPAG